MLLGMSQSPPSAADASRPRRRILYGVHGYGRGHAGRAMAVLPELTRRHDLLVLAGDDAYDQLRSDYPVVRIPVLRYHHGRNHRRSPRLTLQRNAPGALDMLLHGPVSQMIADVARRFQPDVVMSDSEGWTHRVGRRMGIPRISFDHYGIMVHCRLPMSRTDRAVCWAESLAYRRLVCRPERVIVAAFYEGEARREGVRVVGPIVRREVRETEPTAGEHLLVYFTNAETHFTPQVEDALRRAGCPVKVYGPRRRGTEGTVEFCPIGNLPFIRDLASCRGVLSTSGNQLISESIHLGKPLLTVPEEALEQRLNAQFVQDWRIGMRADRHRITPELIRAFLDRTDEFAANIPAHRRDGLTEALDAIEEALDDLIGPPQRS